MALPLLGREGWGHPGMAGSAGTPRAGQPPCRSCGIPALLGASWGLRVLLPEGEGSPAEPCPAFLSRLSAAPQVFAGCCWFMSQLGAAEGRHLVGSQRALINCLGGWHGRLWLGEQRVPRGSSRRRFFSETWLSCNSERRSGCGLRGGTTR